MNYLNLLQLLARIVKSGKLPQAIVIITAIAENFQQLVDLFKTQGLMGTGSVPFIGTQEIALEKEIATAVAAEHGEKDLALGAMGTTSAINFERLRELFISLKNAGVMDMLIAVLTRLLAA